MFNYFVDFSPFRISKMPQLKNQKNSFTAYKPEGILGNNENIKQQKCHAFHQFIITIFLKILNRILY